MALVSATLATYFWILVAVLGLALDRFGGSAEEQEEGEDAADPVG
ncbi:MAG TPA: hypothetical protein VIK57_05080 [Streptosporangiaceae bacterium]